MGEKERNEVRRREQIIRNKQPVERTYIDVVRLHLHVWVWRTCIFWSFNFLFCYFFHSSAARKSIANINNVQLCTCAACAPTYTHTRHRANSIKTIQKDFSAKTSTPSRPLARLHATGKKGSIWWYESINGRRRNYHSQYTFCVSNKFTWYARTPCACVPVCLCVPRAINHFVHLLEVNGIGRCDNGGDGGRLAVTSSWINFSTIYVRRWNDTIERMTTIRWI